MEFRHTSVMLRETCDALDLQKGGIYIDCTLGGGGHSEVICREIGADGILIGIDRDEDAITAAGQRLKDYRCFRSVHSNYTELEAIAEEAGVAGKVNGVLMDLGVSSHQLDDAERGFSYHVDAPLDMRMDKREKTTAADLVNNLPEKDLERIIREYGEDKFSNRIAAAIVRAREISPILTTMQLSEVVSEAYPAKFRKDKHPARKTFQSIRAYLNRELTGLPVALEAAYRILAPGGRLAVISFHSLEDRIVKQFLRDKESGCTCPPQFPVCICGNQPKMKSVIRKPLEPTEEETEANPRARSAKLRVSEKLL